MFIQTGNSYEVEFTNGFLKIYKKKIGKYY